MLLKLVSQAYPRMLQCSCLWLLEVAELSTNYIETPSETVVLLVENVDMPSCNESPGAQLQQSWFADAAEMQGLL